MDILKILPLRSRSNRGSRTKSRSDLLTEFPLSLGDLGDLGDQKYFYQWNSEKRNWNLNEFPIFPWNWVHFIQSNSDNANNYINAFPILRTTFWMHFRLLWTVSLCFLRFTSCLCLSLSNSIPSHLWVWTVFNHLKIFCSSPHPKVSPFGLIVTTQVY